MGKGRFIRFLQCFENRIGSVGHKTDSVQRKKPVVNEPDENRLNR